jgi:hypothetical protein
VATAITIVATAIMGHRRSLNVAGVLGLIAFSARLAALYFNSTATALVVFVLGVSAVGVVVWRSLHRGPGPGKTPPEPPVGTRSGRLD